MLRQPKSYYIFAYHQRLTIVTAPRSLLILLALIGTGLMIYFLNRGIFGETHEDSLVRSLVWTGVVVIYIVYRLTRNRA